MTLNEVISLPPLQPARKVKLKDGLTGVVTMSRDFNNPDDEDRIYVSITINGSEAGFALFGKNNVSDWDEEAIGSWSCMSLMVYPEFLRKGAATAMYDTMTKAGYKIIASGRYGGKLLPDGAKLWQSIQPSIRLGKPLPKPQRFWKVKRKTK